MGWGLTKLKILVVEDDLSMQQSICMGLRKFGYAVDVASDGEEALQMVESMNMTRSYWTGSCLESMGSMEHLWTAASTDSRTLSRFISMISKRSWPHAWENMK
jgi:CheY-like chemotaxis protein